VLFGRISTTHVQCTVPLKPNYLRVAARSFVRNSKRFETMFWFIFSALRNRWKIRGVAGKKNQLHVENSWCDWKRKQLLVT